MSWLYNTTVKRGGVTAKYWYGTIQSVSISAAAEMRIRFSMSSKGGGDTQVEMRIEPEDFSTIVETMMLVDRQAAMEAMTVDINRQVATQRERDGRVTSSGASTPLSFF
jgi:hypothetical protein